MAEERGAFAFGDVVERISARLIRRHPHVFGGAKAPDAQHVSRTWARIKAEEKELRAYKRGEEPSSSFVGDAPTALPALTRAVKLQARASKVAFG